MPDMFLRHPKSVILNPYDRISLIIVNRNSYMNPSLFVREFKCVGEKVEDHLIEHIGIKPCVQLIELRMQPEINLPFLSNFLKSGHYVADKLDQVNLRCFHQHLPVFYFSEIH